MIFLGVEQADGAPSFLHECGHTASVSERPSPLPSSPAGQNKEVTKHAIRFPSCQYEDCVQGVCVFMTEIDTNQLTEAVISTDQLAKFRSDTVGFVPLPIRPQRLAYVGG